MAIEKLTKFSWGRRSAPAALGKISLPLRHCGARGGAPLLRAAARGYVLTALPGPKIRTWGTRQQQPVPPISRSASPAKRGGADFAAFVPSARRIQGLRAVVRVALYFNLPGGILSYEKDSARSRAHLLPRSTLCGAGAGCGGSSSPPPSPSSSPLPPTRPVIG